MGFDVVKLWNTAKQRASSAFAGGLDISTKKVAEQMKEMSVSTATSVAFSAASYGIGKIPLVGSEVSFLFNKAVSDPAQSMINAKTIDKLLEEASKKGEIHKIIQYKNQQVESSFGDVLGQYIAMREYFEINMNNKGLPTSCDEAFKAAYQYCVAKKCIKDLEKNVAAIEELVGHLKGEIDKMKPGIKREKQLIMSRLTLWGASHPEKKRCGGLQGCYFNAEQFAKETKRDLSMNDAYFGDDDL